MGIRGHALTRGGHVGTGTSGQGEETREARRLRGLVDQTKAELKGGSIGRPDDWLGIFNRSIYPGLRFPLERYPSCNLPPGAATCHLRMGLKSLNLSLTVGLM